MNIPKAVIVDLLPVYLAGDASPETRALVEDYLLGDPALAERIRDQWTRALGTSPAMAVPPDLELRSLRGTHRRVWLQIALFSLMLACFGIGFGQRFSLDASGLHPVGGHAGALWLFAASGIGFGLAFLRVRLHMRGGLARH